jgi:hypothetical protein
MILELRLPETMPQMQDAIIESIMASPGEKLLTGQGLMDITVDLSASYLHDCPPVSRYRIVAREAVWVRDILHEVGSRAAVGDLLALFSTTLDEPLDAPAVRSLRVMTAVVTVRSQLW